MKIRKIIIRILFVLLAVVAAVLVVRAVLNFTEGRRLARTLADLKAKGVPLTVKDLITPCPEGKNGAPLWKAAEELYAFEGEDIKLLNEVYQGLIRDTPVAADKWQAIARLIEKNRKVLDLIPDVAGKPCFQYGDTGVKSWDKKIPNGIKTIRAVRLLGLESLLAADKGDVRASLDLLRVGLRFAPKIAEERTLITYLIAVADMKACLMFLNKAVSGREVSAELLLPVLGDLGDSQIGHWKGLLRDSIRGERVMFMDVGLPLSPAALQQAFGRGKAWTERLYYWLLRPFVKRDINLNLPKYEELETLGLLSYYQTREFWKPYQDFLNGLPWYAIISKIVVPEFETVFMKVATLDALILTSRVGLACRVYKSSTGEYPENLEALVPGLLTEVPVDPFTGKPLVYRREGEGFIVYSLGSNLKDDGGRSTWEISRLVMDKDDDWTWKEVR
ncbi:MAG TPA: hypothetical protein VMY15_01015 [Candidatus Latescibacteria bacterium]|nr:hypothetical protein [Candidatus Latescibacterota bacterium]